MTFWKLVKAVIKSQDYEYTSTREEDKAKKYVIFSIIRK